MEVLAAPADRARRFSRFWTREIGLLHEGLLDTPHSLTEARVIYELGQVPDTTATALAQSLALDPGHLSRVLAGLESSGRRLAQALARRWPRAADLADRAPAALRSPSSTAARPTQASELLERLPPDSQGRLLGAMADDRGAARLARVRSPVARDPAAAAGRVRLGDPAPRRAVCAGVRLRHEFEALVAQIVAVLARALTIRHASAAGSPRSTASPSARSSASTWAAESRSCAC